MYEHLQLGARRGVNARDLFGAELACEHHATNAKRHGKAHACSIGAGHLRRCMHVQTGCDRGCELGHSQVLHDDRVDAGACASEQGLTYFGKLVIKHEGVERDVAFHSSKMELVDHVA